MPSGQSPTGRSGQEAGPADPGVTLEAVIAFVTFVPGVIATLYVLAWLKTPRLEWPVAVFITASWFAVATMGWRRLYPDLTPEDLAGIRSYQKWLLLWPIMCLLPGAISRARLENHPDRMFLVAAGFGALLIGWLLNGSPPRTPRLRTRAHRVIGAIGWNATWLYTMLYVFGA